MDFALTEEQKMLQDMAKNFAENEIKPYVEEDEKNQHWRKEIFFKMAELGFFGFCIDEKFGGNGMGFLEGALVIEQVAKVHTSWRMPFNMQCWGPSLTLQKFGTEEQKQRYIPKFMTGEYVGSFAMTEADQGSDVAGMRCRADDKGDYYLLNGNKMFITNGTVCNHGLLYAKRTRTPVRRESPASSWTTLCPESRAGSCTTKSACWPRIQRRSTSRMSRSRRALSWVR